MRLANLACMLADVIELDEYCHKRGIALVPNQNSCGHFHRFLKHERYRKQQLLRLLKQQLLRPLW